MAKHSLSDSESAAVRFFEKAVELKERIYADEFGGYISAAIAGIDEAGDAVMQVPLDEPVHVRPAYDRIYQIQRTNCP